MAVEVTSISFKKTIDSTPVNWLLANLDDDITIELDISTSDSAISSQNSPWILNNNDGYISDIPNGHYWVTGGDFSKFNIGDTLLAYDYVNNVSFGYILIIDKTGITLTDQENPLKKVRIVSGGVFLSDHLDINGNGIKLN